jgi:2-C-methyl-D-erythritol 4-phosphate cytidylyltransferase
METNSTVRYWAVVPAAGQGQRMASDVPKQYLEVAGQPVLQHCLQNMLDWGFLENIVVVLQPDDQRWSSLPVATDPAVISVVGGRERSDSVLAGLAALAELAAADDWVLVHDAARPCVLREDVERLREQLRDDPVGGILAQPVSETVKRADAENRTLETVDRSGLWLAQTPQMFRYQVLVDALADAARRGLVVTDESAALEQAGLRPQLVAGAATNIKITQAGDLAFAELWLQRGS